MLKLLLACMIEKFLKLHDCDRQVKNLKHRLTGHWSLVTGHCSLKSYQLPLR